MQNTIIKGTDNRVNIVFTFTGEFTTNGLNEFTRITLALGNETYDTSVNTDELVIVSDTELSLRISDSTSLAAGFYLPTIKGFNSTFNDGFPLTSECSPELGMIKVCD